MAAEDKLAYQPLSILQLRQPSEIALVYRRIRLSRQPSDLEYWLSQSPQARLAALESIRGEYHGWTDTTQPRVQRVCTVAKLR